MQSYLFEWREARNAWKVRRILNQILGNRTNEKEKLQLWKWSFYWALDVRDTIMCLFTYVRPIVEFVKHYLKIDWWRIFFLLYWEIESENDHLSFSSNEKSDITCVSETDFMLELGFFRIYWTPPCRRQPQSNFSLLLKLFCLNGIWQIEEIFINFPGISYSFIFSCHFHIIVKLGWSWSSGFNPNS